MKKILLFVLMLVLGSFSFAENVVITSIQPLYSLTSYLTKGTDIKVYTPFGSDVSMTMSKDSIREEGFDLAIAKKAQAVVDIAKVWPEDVIYGAENGSPSSTPIAIPVIAACPTASEKKAIFFVTTIVPIPPSIGPINNAHIIALITKPYLKEEGISPFSAKFIKKLLKLSNIFSPTK